MTPSAPKKYAHLLGLAGFSDALLTNHFTLYEGYVVNVNKIAERLATIASSNEPLTPEYAELKRRFGWEWNGMRLHELYFDNLSKTATALQNTTLTQHIIQDFGSVTLWEKDFRATGGLRGIGWAIVVFDKETGKLSNLWVNEHDMGYLAGTVPLLIMDVFEHAYMLDYGIKRAEYIDTFFRSIDWAAVESRFVKI